MQFLREDKNEFDNFSLLQLKKLIPWTMHRNARKSAFQSWADPCEYLSFDSDLYNILDQQPYQPMSFA